MSRTTHQLIDTTTARGALDRKEAEADRVKRRRRAKESHIVNVDELGVNVKRGHAAKGESKGKGQSQGPSKGKSEGPTKGEGSRSSEDQRSPTSSGAKRRRSVRSCPRSSRSLESR